MASGDDDAQQIMRAYLDRIAAYDSGPLGLHSVITVAPDAMAQAKAADDARAAGDTRPLLGIPILAKDIFDTKDMPTTGGALVFAGYQPTKDAWHGGQAARGRRDHHGQGQPRRVRHRRALQPERVRARCGTRSTRRSRSIGSSGGSAVAVASSFAAAALGTQTGDSLWGPSSAASLVSLRGTDGMQSTDGVMPLTYVQDYAGVDQPHAAGPRAAAQRDHDRQPGRPARRRRQRAPPGRLDAGAERERAAGQGDRRARRRRSTIRSARPGTSDAMRAQFAHFVEAGATVKPITDPPGGPARTPGDRGYEGWRQWVLAHPDNPYTDVPCDHPQPAAPAAVPQHEPVHRHGRDDARAGRRLPGRARELPGGSSAAWMDAQGVDAVVFPGQLSRHPPQRLDPAELRPARPAGLGRGRAERDLPGRRQRPRPADQPAAAGQGVRRPQAARHSPTRSRPRPTGTSSPAIAPDAAVRDEHARARSAASVPATLVADARRAGDVRRVHAGRREGLHRVDDAPT